jgi:hypothetical protein
MKQLQMSNPLQDSNFTVPTISAAGRSGELIAKNAVAVCNNYTGYSL